jgi:hypothetical protein
MLNTNYLVAGRRTVQKEFPERHYKLHTFIREAEITLCTTYRERGVAQFCTKRRPERKLQSLLGAKQTDVQKSKTGRTKNSSRMEGTARIYTLVSSDVSKWMWILITAVASHTCRSICEITAPKPDNFRNSLVQDLHWKANGYLDDDLWFMLQGGHCLSMN